MPRVRLSHPTPLHSLPFHTRTFTPFLLILLRPSLLGAPSPPCFLFLSTLHFHPSALICDRDNSLTPRHTGRGGAGRGGGRGAGGWSGREDRGRNAKLKMLDCSTNPDMDGAMHCRPNDITLNQSSVRLHHRNPCVVSK